MNRVVHFEIPLNDPEKGAAFYEKIFGWEITKWDGSAPYWLVSTGDPAQPGINGGLLKKQDPQQPVVNTIEVQSVDDTLNAIVKAGGSVALPKMPIPGVGWLAYFKDPEGNISGIMQNDKSAK